MYIADKTSTLKCANMEYFVNFSVLSATVLCLKSYFKPFLFEIPNPGKIKTHGLTMRSPNRAFTFLISWPIPFFAGFKDVL